jgi:hypothetical protein
MSQRSLAAVEKLRAFAEKKIIPSANGSISWAEYATKGPRIDEETVIQPVVFPAFASDVLGWDLQANLAAETSSEGGKPDFTPADAVTHPFVFETKGTNAGVALGGFDEQVLKYLTFGAPRIQRVVLTNMLGIRVFDRDDAGNLREVFAVHLAALLVGSIGGIGTSAEAERLADFIEQFSRKELTREQKLDRVRSAPPWTPITAVTSSEWIVSRLDSIVQLLKDRAYVRIRGGILTDRAVVLAEESALVLTELRGLASRLGIEDSDSIPLEDFVTAADSTLLGKATTQYAAHIAFFTAAKLMLVRVWEDLELLPAMLYDGGFDAQMTRFDNVIHDVIGHAYSKAKERYRPLFDKRNAYTWFQPHDDDFADIIYELANTYLGGIESDVLGRVYERMLERIDRKLLGVYYTPRDIIALMWDLVDFDEVAKSAQTAGRTPRILDVATGSGGFLVEAASRMRKRLDASKKAGATVDDKKWLADVVDGLNGVEYQRFAAYLAELNLIVQLSPVVARDKAAGIPELGIITGDTLSFHEPVHMVELDTGKQHEAILEKETDRASRLKAARDNDYLMDVAIGNPPYIGEKLAAPILRATRRDYRYWEQFVGPHMDYLYWFLILGVSKVADDGRFSFITTEYWLRADGARPLRKYLAERADIERIILFRDFRLFPDAKGQHSMIIVGTRRSTPDPRSKTKISIYRGPGDVRLTRNRILDAIRRGRTAALVDTFTGSVAPSAKGGDSWAEVLLTASERKQRVAVRYEPQVRLVATKGVETTLNALSVDNEQHLTQNALMAVGGPGTRPGIQLLSTSEVASLGTLNDAEKKTLRTWVNTRDIYPYAVVVPADAASVVYLPKPNGVALNAGVDPVSGTAFPAGLPAIEKRLNYFRSFLEDNTRGKGERRAWWSLHRARADVVGDATPDAHGWAPFALTTRWGEGGRLVVGLAPANSAPASGLHILRPVTGKASVAYLVGLYNSTIYQELAQSLPPGQLRQADLETIGLPLLSDQQASIEKNVYKLGDIVLVLVNDSARSYPHLPNVLRFDVSLDSFLPEVWTPGKQLEGLDSGTLDSVKWATVSVNRVSSKIGDVVRTHDLVGHVLSVRAKNDPTKTIAEIYLEDIVSDDAAEALTAMIRELGWRSLEARELKSLAVPLTAIDLAGMKKTADAAVEATISVYKQLRDAIDTDISTCLAARG